MTPFAPYRIEVSPGEFGPLPAIEGVSMDDGGLSVSRVLTSDEAADLASSARERETQDKVFGSIELRQRELFYTFDVEMLAEWIEKVLASEDAGPLLEVVDPEAPGVSIQRIVEGASDSHIPDVARPAVSLVLQRFQLNQESAERCADVIHLCAALGAKASRQHLRGLLLRSDLDSLQTSAGSLRVHVLRGLGGLADEGDLDAFVAALGHPESAPIAFEVLSNHQPLRRGEFFVGAVGPAAAHSAEATAAVVAALMAGFPADDLSILQDVLDHLINRSTLANRAVLGIIRLIASSGELASFQLIGSDQDSPDARCWLRLQRPLESGIVTKEVLVGQERLAAIPTEIHLKKAFESRGRPLEEVVEKELVGA